MFEAYELKKPDSHEEKSIMVETQIKCARGV